MINLTCWGTRGGIPVSGARFIRHGGATTCIELVFDAAQGATPERIIFDCGSGLAEMGRVRGFACDRALILQTHMHWDHIQGFPFFAPLFNPAAHFEIWAVPREERSMKTVLGDQMQRPTFPVGLDIIPATLGFEDLRNHGRRTLGEVEIRWIELDHPGGSTAYRVDYRGRSVVFSGDVEVRQGCRQALVDFARGADVLIMDAQYFCEEYLTKQGFGHSTVLDAVGVAREAGVGRLLMTHHDAAHDDVRLEEKVNIARRAMGNGPIVDNAHDGLYVKVTGIDAFSEVHAAF